MKDWFPFTNYDFYAYLTCGFVTIFALDYWYSDGQYILQTEWSFSEGLLAVSLSYVVGQLVAIPATSIFEGALVRWILRRPISVLLDSQHSRAEKFVNFLIGRYYSPFPSGVRQRIFARAEQTIKLTPAELIADPEELFLAAYHVARKEEDTRARVDDFRNQYGFSRNMALSGILASALMLHKALVGHDTQAWAWFLFALVLSIGMLVRFWKFYCSFTAEALRAYAFEKVMGDAN